VVEMPSALSGVHMEKTNLWALEGNSQDTTSPVVATVLAASMLGHTVHSHKWILHRSSLGTLPSCGPRHFAEEVAGDPTKLSEGIAG
jgi:hypothetical protein